jgi:hypothetical protein
MIRIGSGTMNTRFGFGTDPNFKVIMKGIRIAIGTAVMRVAEIFIIVPAKATAVKANIPSIKKT